jgi:hypothetical protein
MMRNNMAKEKLEGFINKLELRGYQVKEAQKKPQIYCINGELVKVRSRGKVKEIADGSRLFWYDVAFSVLEEVKRVIYLATEANYFLILPSSFLKSLKDGMYPVRSKAGVGVFDIDWDSLMIELQGKREPIDRYYHNLIYRKDYPIF